MFGGGAANTYDDIVAKTTDENLTTENWELIINLCDKVTDEGEQGARDVTASVLKRLAHRNPNVQLYALSLTEALSKNCGEAIDREIASRAFTQGLEKIVMDRTTHDKVRKRTLVLIGQWATEFEGLGVMEDCASNLKAKGYKFDAPPEPLPPAVDDDIRRKEEEELQRVLEMSMQDRGGRDQWAAYSLASSSGAGGSKAAAGSSSSNHAAPSGSASGAASSSAAAAAAPAAPKYPSGYVPARTPSPQRQPASPQQPSYAAQTHYTHSNASNVSAGAAASAAAQPSSTTTTNPNAIVTRVRALHAFEPTEPGELAFEKGDIIKVVDRGYQDWWRGQLKGRTGIFPVNYVEPMPEPTAADLAKEAEQEAAVFAQAVNVEKLLNLLRAFDPAKDSLADNEEIQELYRSSMALRPKIVKLIDKYSQKRADLVSMNETFVRARTIFDRMMEESLARHTGVYEAQHHQSAYRPPPSSSAGGSRIGGGRPEYGQSAGSPVAYGWGAQQVPYGTPTAAGVVPGFPEMVGPVAYPTPVPAPAPAPTPGPSHGMHPSGVPYGYPGHGPQQQQQQQPVAGAAAYSVQGPTPYPAVQPQPQQQQPQSQPQLQPQPQQQSQALSPQGSVAGLQPQQQQQQQQQPSQSQPQVVQVQPQSQQPQYGQSPYGQYDLAQSQTVQGVDHSQYQVPQQQQQQAQQAVQAPASTQPQPQPQPQSVQSPSQAQAQTDQHYQQQQQQQQQPQSQPQPQPQAQPQTQQQHQPSTQSGPPYVFDPNATYADPNVQAWAQYYAQGGRDLAGSVYFVSIPGLTDGTAPGSPGVEAGGGQQQQQGQQGQGQPQQQGQGQGQPQQHAAGAGFDQGVFSVTPSGFYGAAGAGASSSVSSAGGGGQAQLQPQQQQTQPNNLSSSSLGVQHQQQPAMSGQQQPTQHSPTMGSFSASTPSWVLPKKENGGGAGGPGASGGGGGGGGRSRSPGLAGQFAGVSLTDPGSTSV